MWGCISGGIHEVEAGDSQGQPSLGYTEKLCLSKIKLGVGMCPVSRVPAWLHKAFSTPHESGTWVHVQDHSWLISSSMPAWAIHTLTQNDKRERLRIECCLGEVRGQSSLHVSKAKDSRTRVRIYLLPEINGHLGSVQQQRPNKQVTPGGLLEVGIH